MNVTSNLKPGEFLDPGPFLNLIADSVYRALLAEQEAHNSEVDSEDQIRNGEPDHNTGLVSGLIEHPPSLYLIEGGKDCSPINESYSQS